MRKKPGVVARTCCPNTREVGAGGGRDHEFKVSLYYK